MKNNFYARKTRQLKYRIKLLKNYSADPKDNKSKSQKLIAEIKTLIHDLKYVVSTRKLQRIIGGVAIMLGLTLGSTLQAQQFGKRMEFPFGISQLTQVSIPALGDLDGDGDYDLLSGNYNGDYEFTENIGSPTAPAFTTPLLDQFGLANDYQFNFPVLGDLDNDGDLDILAYTNYGQMTYYENVGNENIPLFAGTPIDNPFGIQFDELIFPELADLDNDGDLDLIGGSEYGIQYFENIGTSENPNFANAILNPFGLGLSDPNSEYIVPTLSDIDNDGDLDMLRFEYYGTFTYQENIGDTENPAFGTPLINPFGLTNAPGDEISFLTMADMDGDGDEDLITSSYSGAIAYYELLGSPDGVGTTELLIANNTTTIFPNPTNHSFRIQSEVVIKSVAIFDMVGRTILLEDFIGQSIDVHTIPTGAYIVKMKTDKDEIVISRFEKI